MRSDITPGGTFPDYELPDHTDTPRKLSGLQGDDPMILTLARGHYCPKEHQQHLELAAFYPKVAVAYTQIATIATDEHHGLQEFRASVGAQWTFLSDPGRTVQTDLDIQAARDQLAARGVDASEVFHPETPGAQFQPDPTSGRVDGAADDRASYGSFAAFNDPDGNGWLLQEVTTRLPGRIEAAATSYASENDLVQALIRAATAHGEHEELPR
jgi:peroxiredoxin